MCIFYIIIIIIIIIIISLYRNLYNEGTLCPDIRCSLADALVAAVSSDLKGNVLFLTRKRKKKGQSLANWYTQNFIHKLFL